MKPPKTQRCSALSRMAYKLTELGKIDLALQLAGEIKNETSKDSALSRLASELIESGKIDLALQLAGEIKNEASKDPVRKVGLTGAVTSNKPSTSSECYAASKLLPRTCCPLCSSRYHLNLSKIPILSTDRC